MLAAENGHTKIAQLLITFGADVNATYNYGHTALMLAASNGHTETVKLLIAAVADVNAKTNDGMTALMKAASNGHTEIAQLLISAGADCNGISPIDVFILKHPNLFKDATISAVAGVGYKIWQNFNK